MNMPISQAEGRVSTGIPGLDAMLNGGFLQRTANLIEGPPGCGKTTLGMQFIYEGARRGEPGIILTFEEFPEQYYRDATAYGWDFHTLERQNLLKIIMSSPEVTTTDLEQIDGTLQETMIAMNAQRMLVDSITHFERLSRDAVILRQRMFSFLNALKRHDMTILLTRETNYLLGEEVDDMADTGIHFLADAYVLLRYVEIESAIQRAIIVMKMRGSAHESAIRQFDIDREGLKVLKPFAGQEGLMSGTPRRMADSFIKAFVRR